MKNLSILLLVALFPLPGLLETVERNSQRFSLDTQMDIMDSDADGIPDWWERLHGTNLQQDDTEEDIDGDGRSTMQEYSAGTDPTLSDERQSSFWTSNAFVVDTSFELGSPPISPIIDEIVDGGTIGTLSLAFKLNTSQFPYSTSLDSDSDLIPDWWEDKYGSNRLEKDADDDPDQNNQSWLTEYSMGLQTGGLETDEVSLSSSIFSLMTISHGSLDSDGDRIPDVWESKFGLALNVPDGFTDTDGDGKDALEEYNAGSNPLIPESSNKVTQKSKTFRLSTGGLALPYFLDTDEDDLPDWWEIAHQLNHQKPNDGDSDGDGLNDREEFLLGLSPSRPDFLGTSSALSRLFLVDTGGIESDQDDDGLPDWWEEIFFLNKTAAVPSTDSDNDQHSNYEEYLAGTDPRDSTSILRITHIEILNPNVLRVTWASSPGVSYQIVNASIDSNESALSSEVVEAKSAFTTTIIETENRAHIFFRVLAARP